MPPLGAAQLAAAVQQQRLAEQAVQRKADLEHARAAAVARAAVALLDVQRDAAKRQSAALAHQQRQSDAKAAAAQRSRQLAVLHAKQRTQQQRLEEQRRQERAAVSEAAAAAAGRRGRSTSADMRFTRVHDKPPDTAIRIVAYSTRRAGLADRP